MPADEAELLQTIANKRREHEYAERSRQHERPAGNSLAPVLQRLAEGPPPTKRLKDIANTRDWIIEQVDDERLFGSTAERLAELYVDGRLPEGKLWYLLRKVKEARSRSSYFNIAGKRLIAACGGGC